MNAVMAVGSLCFRRWKWLPLGALLLGAFGAFTPLDREGPGALAIAMTNMAWLALLTCFVPVVIAPTQVGSRTDFMFAHPVPWWATWLGRAGACLLIGVASVLCLALPAYVVHGIHTPWLLLRRAPFLAGPFFVLGGLASVGYASYRASRQVASLALGGTLLAGVAAVYLVARATAFGLLLAGSTMLAVLFWMLAGALLTFSAVYLAAGRGEPVRAAVSAGVAAAVACVPVIAVAGAINLGWI